MTTYRSKIDHWLWVLIVAIFIASYTPAFFTPDTPWLPIILTLIFPAFLIINIYTNTYYTIDEEKQILRVKSGFIVDYKYDINKITHIRNTGTWLSGPALSLDRIEITLDKRRKVVISPLYKPQFIKHLTSLNPNITVED